MDTDNVLPNLKKKMVFWNSKGIDEKFENLHSSFIEKFENLALKVENVTNILHTKKSVINNSTNVSNSSEKKQEEYDELATLVVNSTDIESFGESLS